MGSVACDFGWPLQPDLNRKIKGFILAAGSILRVNVV